MGRPLDQGLLPGMDLAGVDFKPAGQLGIGVLPLEAHQGYLGLEGRAVLLLDLLQGPVFVLIYRSRALALNLT